MAISWLVLCSLFFYGWWNPRYLLLIICSMVFNYVFGVMLSNRDNRKIRKGLLAFGVTINLALLGYFKYTNFFVAQVSWGLGLDYRLDEILLPLAISFFTFQQIAYLVDAYRHEVKEYNFLQYSLFVTFFPQLIAGPIVHHKEMLPQFDSNHIYKFNYEHMAIGLSIFVIGLFKKVIIADGMALYASPIFAAADAYEALTFFEAWGGALAYTFQLYFDFSGYSDMAVGIAYMFGIKLSLNFNSPYKATSIIDFWRRWHMTLSRFLRDYLYIALGGNRKGPVRRYINLFLTMLLGGFWHGAGWTFIVWGMLHGIYLIINHAWGKIRKDLLKWSDNVGFVELTAARMLTFTAVMIGWVYFRAGTFAGANHLILSMFGFHGVAWPVRLETGLKWSVLLFIVVLTLPNTQELTISPSHTLHNMIMKRPRMAGALLGGGLFYVFLHLNEITEFLYFNF